MAVFRFRLQQLDKIHRNSRDRRRETAFLKKQFQHWEINENTEIVLSEETLQGIITAEDIQPEESARLLVQWADKLGAIFKATKLSSSQLRDFFGEEGGIHQQASKASRARRRDS